MMEMKETKLEEGTDQEGNKNIEWIGGKMKNPREPYFLFIIISLVDSIVLVIWWVSNKYFLIELIN